MSNKSVLCKCQNACFILTGIGFTKFFDSKFLYLSCKLKYKVYVVVKRLVVVFLVMFAFSVYPGGEKEVVVGSADELKGIKLVIVKGGQLIKPKKSFGRKMEPR